MRRRKNSGLDAELRELERRWATSGDTTLGERLMHRLQAAGLDARAAAVADALGGWRGAWKRGYRDGLAAYQPGALMSYPEQPKYQESYNSAFAWGWDKAMKTAHEDASNPSGGLDAELREAERKALASGDPADMARWKRLARAAGVPAINVKASVARQALAEVRKNRHSIDARLNLGYRPQIIPELTTVIEALAKLRNGVYARDIYLTTALLVALGRFLPGRPGNVGTAWVESALGAAEYEVGRQDTHRMRRGWRQQARDREAALVECPDCGRRIHRRGLGSHRQGNACLASWRAREAREAGWVPTGWLASALQVRAAEQLGVPVNIVEDRWRPGSRGNRGTWGQTVYIRNISGESERESAERMDSIEELAQQMRRRRR
jgi:hypothetical protein